MKNPIFTEEQKYSHPWIWMVIFPILATLIFLLQINETENKSLSELDQDALLGLIIMSCIFFVMMLGLTVLFYKMKLSTRITQDAIYFKYPPIVVKEKKITKNEIKSYEVRKFQPGKEYGGHGVKKGRRKVGRGYTVGGRIGLQLYLKSGEKILIGTRRKEAIRYAMEKMMSTKNI
ncbi:MAG: hypothetical protein K9G76_12060 [Bacteroidales bacterium]|nr:hypothetical protein [Bacteroidales bacterium]MCF8405262.1 hypothetical protein [Bacteroidales bacterium]